MLIIEQNWLKKLLNFQHLSCTFDEFLAKCANTLQSEVALESFYYVCTLRVQTDV